jgi:hypothetical protein
MTVWYNVGSGENGMKHLTFALAGLGTLAC